MNRSPRRRRVFLLVAAAVVVVFVAVTAIVTASRSHRDKPSAQACAPVPVPSASPAAAPAGSDLLVAEQGFSLIRTEGKVEGYDRISIGATIRNASNRTAYGTRLVINAYFANGKSALREHVDGIKRRIPVIPAGGQVGVGSVANLIQKSSPNTGVLSPIDRVTVTVVSTSWLDLEPSNPLAHPAVTTIVDVGHPDLQQVVFTAVGLGCRGLLIRGSSAVFRDAGGRIIGGADGGVPASYVGDCAEFSCRQYYIYPQEVPANRDPAKTTVSVFSDIAGAPYATDVVG